MDLSIRDWMLVIGVLLILAVLLDGYRRVRRDRVRKVRMSLKPVPAGDGSEGEQLTRGELPNGGARVAVRSGRSSAHQEPTFGDDWQTEFRAPSAAADTGFDDAELPDVDAVKSHFTAPVFKTGATEQAAAQVHPAADKSSFETVLAEVTAADQIVEPVAIASPEPVVRSKPMAPAREAAFASESVGAVSEPAPTPTSTGVKEIIVVNAVSKDPLGFNGEELLHILLTCDLRFGKMNIFHRYEKSNAKGAVQFSVANAVEPGTFDLNSMRNFKTPGICLFLQLPGPQDAQKALEYMVETAQCIARNLNGELRDENRSALTAQTVEHFRSRIREFDRKRMAKHA
jgi:cell division protein ZipA